MTNNNGRRKPPLPGEPDGIDKGIEREVMVLWENGIETYASCEGGCRMIFIEGGVNGTLIPKWIGSTGHIFPVPTVCFHGQAGEGYKAYSIARDHDLNVKNLRRVYSASDGELVGPHWEMTFFRPR